MAYTTDRNPNHTTNNYTTNTTVPPQRSGSGVAIAIGAIVALVAIVAYFVIAAPAGPDADNVNVSVDAPAAVERAADDAGDAAAAAGAAVEDAAEDTGAAIDRAVE
ncbi:hypothetical protein [Pararhodobacter sp. CCB-MM2]|uniref:hypothetical protein n=1 Tax=Pararhodobacter sp. CCB-MM2 TaxID=1786003 RepID=UPI00082F4750|nr:hypothetical protein [Pararhodobacter sp. CCB-MM2]MCA2012914.1 hypothetical protein [Cereibacter sphaeroides]